MLNDVLHHINDNSLFQIPGVIPTNSNYIDFVSQKFNQYMDIIKNLPDTPAILEKHPDQIKKDVILKKQLNFTKELINVIDLYLEGKPHESYFKFSDIINERIKKFKSLINYESIPSGESFYRIRLNKNMHTYKGGEMFHIPFHRRYLVATQRYSIPGYPSLYAGKTLYVAWEELGRPKLDNINASRLENTADLRILNLTYPHQNASESDLYKFFILWPLILACTTRVQHPESPFKIEYVIPQLLLQWVRDNKEVDGVKYYSSHIEIDFSQEIGGIYNLVFPIKENKKENFCPVLTSKFLITDAVSPSLLDITSGGGNFLYSSKETTKINQRVPQGEIITGKKISYGYSKLGALERYLDAQEAKPLL